MLNIKLNGKITDLVNYISIRTDKYIEKSADIRFFKVEIVNDVNDLAFFDYFCKYSGLNKTINCVTCNSECIVMLDKFRTLFPILNFNITGEFINSNDFTDIFQCVISDYYNNEGFVFVNNMFITN